MMIHSEHQQHSQREGEKNERKIHFYASSQKLHLSSLVVSMCLFHETNRASTIPCYSASTLKLVR